MKVALQEAIDQIKSAGFDHIKVELEGDIGRDGERECDPCEGEGRTDCEYCDGEGYQGTGNYTRLSEQEILEECGDCYGDGRVDCNECDGSGNSGNFMEEYDCEEFMKNHVPREVLDRLVFGKFYEDGSVDSEFTFTVKIDDIEDVLHWMKAFVALADQCDRLDVSGAGLHIGLIPTESNGVYPSRVSLPQDKLDNFQSEVTKLLPALFFLASSGHQSRDMGYRHASIGEDKYNAISTHDGTSFEFRVFETCYYKPEAFYDYVQTIANCLKFYADPSLKVNALGKKFGFTDGSELARFYDTPEQLRILNATVKHLKPRDKTFKKLKEERGVRYTIKSLAQKEKVRLEGLRQDYRQYRRNFMEMMKRPLSESQLRDMEYYISNEGMTRERAEMYVRDRGGEGTLMSLRQFIENQMRHNYDEVVSV